MAYTPTNWVNDSAPAINATNLNKIETGIDDAHDDLDAATDAATAGELIRRDGSGRAKVADPSASGDIANKGWVETQTGLLIPKSLVDAKGDLLVGTADNTVGRLPAGTDGQTIVYDSGEATGMRAADFPSGGGGGDVMYPAAVGQLFTPGAFRAIGGGSGYTATIGTEYAFPVPIPSAGIEVDRIASRVWSGVASLVARVGVYEDAGGIPDTDVLHDLGTIDLTSNGFRSTDLGAPVALDAPVVWISIVQQVAGSPASFMRAQMLSYPLGVVGDLQSGIFGWYERTGSTGALASNTGAWSPHNASWNSDCPLVALRRSA